MSITKIKKKISIKLKEKAHMFGSTILNTRCFPGGASCKEPTCQCRRQETHIQSLGPEDPLEDSMATHSNIFAWRVPWTEELGRLQSIVSQRVGCD